MAGKQRGKKYKVTLVNEDTPCGAGRATGCMTGSLIMLGSAIYSNGQYISQMSAIEVFPFAIFLAPYLTQLSSWFRDSEQEADASASMDTATAAGVFPRAQRCTRDQCCTIHPTSPPCSPRQVRTCSYASSPAVAVRRDRTTSDMGSHGAVVGPFNGPTTPRRLQAPHVRRIRATRATKPASR